MSAWINQIFKAAQSNNNGIVRRSKDSVNKYASEADLLAAVHSIRRAGFEFHVIHSGTQYVIFCNKLGDFKLLI